MSHRPTRSELAEKIRQLEKENAELNLSADLQAQKARQLDLIRQAQSLYIAEEDESRIYSLLLQTLISTTGSEFGFFDEVHRDKDGNLYKKNLAISNISWDHESKSLYAQLRKKNMEFRYLDNLAGHPALTGKMIITNDPANDPRSGGLPEGHPAIHSFMGLPLFFGNELVGVAGVANRDGGYKREIGEFIEPLLATCAGIVYNIRQKKSAHEAQEALWLRNRAIEASNQGITITDPGQPHNPVVYANKGFERICGYEVTEILGRNMGFLQGPDSDPAAVAAIANAMAAENEIAVEILNYHKDGTPFWNQLFISPVRDEFGELVNFIAIHNDISDHQRSDEELRILRLAVEQSADGITIADLAGVILYANPATEAMYGCEPGELVGQHVQDYILNTENLASEVISSIRNTGSWNGELIQRRKDGSRFTIHLSASLVTKGGEAIGLLGIVRDITELKQAENRLKRYAERLSILHSTDRAILEAFSPEKIAEEVLARLYKLIPFDWASVLLFDYDARKARFLACNIEGENMAEKQAPWSFDFMFAGHAPASPENRIVNNIEALSDKSPIEQMLCQLNVRAYASAPLKAKNDVIGLIHLGNYKPDSFRNEDLDVAKEVAASLAIAIQNAQLFQSIDDHRKRLRKLAARLIETEERERKWLNRELHDQIGQNLTALSINLNVLGNLMPEGISSNVAARLNDSLKLVAETTVRIRHLMSELRPPVLDDYGLAAALRWYAEQFSDRYGLPVDLEADEIGPRPAPEIETALFRISQEALTNVVKHAQAGRVAIQLKAVRNRIRVAISDDGCGFDAHAVNQAGIQTGWGLTTLRERIDALGGELQVKSEKGKGTTITVEVKGQMK